MRYRSYARRPCTGQRAAVHADGRLLRFRKRRLRNAVQDAGSRDGETWLLQGVLRGHHRRLVCCDPRHSSRSQPHHLLPARAGFSGQGLCRRLCPWHPDVPVHDGRRCDHRKEAQLPHHQRQVPEDHRDTQAGVHLLLGSVLPVRYHHRYAPRYVHSLRGRCCCGYLLLHRRRSHLPQT